MYGRPSCRKVFIAALTLFFASFAWAQQQGTLQNSFFRVEVSTLGSYDVLVNQSGWKLHGELGTQAKAPKRRHGVDVVGAYEELVFQYEQNGLRQGSIRIYKAKPVLQFEMAMLSSGTNQGSFPAFRLEPEKIYHLGFQPLPHGLHQFGYLGSQGPWVLFDDALHGLILSPEDHFFITDLQSSGSDLKSAITDTVTSLPAGFSHKTVLVAGQGINKTFEEWGQSMQKIAGRKAPANNADILLSNLSYWTDHGGAYFYNFDPALGYPGTLYAVKKRFMELGLTLGSMQLDSWFYPKGKDADWHKAKWTNGVGGAYLYEPAKELFPDGIEVFSKTLGLPLVTHARWIDEFSPYRKEYKMSNNVIIDPRYWQKTAEWLHNANVKVYEQDWMGRYAKAEANLTDPEKFHDLMAEAMQRKGLTMQYCMAAPADFMQGSHYDNLTTIRTSHDRFDRKDWDDFLYDSRVAEVLGIWPWTDVFRSSEQGNLIVSTLSAGPVGVGDAMDEIDAKDLMHAIRADGVIVKPDVTIRPLDHMYLDDARGAGAPMLATSWTSFGEKRINYLFAYARGKEKTAPVQLEDLGFTADVYAYNWRTQAGAVWSPHTTYSVPLDQDGWGYEVVTPIGLSGMALVGDPEQIATAGRNRISQFSDNGEMRIAMQLSAGEKERVLTLYAQREPVVTVSAGRLEKSSYDKENHLVSLTLSGLEKSTVLFTVKLPASGSVR